MSNTLIAASFVATLCALGCDAGDQPVDLFEDADAEQLLEAAALKSCTASKLIDTNTGLRSTATASLTYGKVSGAPFVRQITWSIANNSIYAGTENKITLRFQYLEGGKWKDAARESFIRTKLPGGSGQGTVNAGLLTSYPVRAKIHFSWDLAFPLPTGTGACYIDLK